MLSSICNDVAIGVLYIVAVTLVMLQHGQNYLSLTNLILIQLWEFLKQFDDFESLKNPLRLGI